jgi:hypothetical protein
MCKYLFSIVFCDNNIFGHLYKHNILSYIRQSIRLYIIGKIVPISTLVVVGDHLYVCPPYTCNTMRFHSHLTSVLFSSNLLYLLIQSEYLF